MVPIIKGLYRWVGTQSTVLGASRGIYSVFLSHKYASGPSIRLLEKNWSFRNILDLLALLWKEIKKKIACFPPWSNCTSIWPGTLPQAARFDESCCTSARKMTKDIKFHISFCHSPWQHTPRCKVNIKTYISNISSKTIIKLTFLS